MFDLVQAYGRNHSDPGKVLKDWDDGKDFKIVGGPYCSIRDLPKMKHVVIYFGNNSMEIKYDGNGTGQ